jgi:hypothetical protein
MDVRGKLHVSAALPRGKRPLTGCHRIRGWVGPRVSLDILETENRKPLSGIETRILGFSLLSLIAYTDYAISTSMDIRYILHITIFRHTIDCGQKTETRFPM